MKTMKKLIPALAMLLVSAVLLGTSTFAWFSMNSQVTATGMKVKAQAEGGIVISNESKQDWKASANASHVIDGTTLVATELIPTSTANATNWFHATSDDANDARKEQEVAKYAEYTKSSADATYKITESDGVGTVTMGSGTKGIYLLNKFYIQSSADEITLGNDGLYINSVTATSTTSNTAALNKSLRVAIVLNDGTTSVTRIFSPIEGADDTYKVKNTTSIDPINAGVQDTTTGLKNIPAYNSTGTGAIEAAIYIYFEGEDSNCKSANLASTIDTIDVQVVFGTTKVGL